MPQLPDLPDAPDDAVDGELLYTRLPSGTEPSRKRALSTLIAYFRSKLLEAQNITLVCGADTTPPVLGNGPLTGRVQRLGKLVTVQGSLTIGSTTTLGSGPWFFQLPSPFNNSAVAAAVGAVRARDTTGSLHRVGACEVAEGANKIYLFADDEAAGWGASAPQAWAAGDTLRFSLTFETV